MDLRSLNFRVQAPPVYRPRSYTWRPGPLVLDQGQEGACVGFGWAHELAARPAIVPNVSNGYARSLYKAAQLIDEWPGEDYSGTSVLAGAKTVRTVGLISEYRWCLTIDDLIVALGYFGPVVIGVDWYTGMFNTNAEGYVKPTGYIEGGHCVILNGVSIRRNSDPERSIDYMRSFVSGVNSWGTEWGSAGRFRIALIDLMKLFPGGDFCVPMGRKVMAL